MLLIFSVISMSGCQSNKLFFKFDKNTTIYYAAKPESSPTVYSSGYDFSLYGLSSDSFWTVDLPKEWDSFDVNLLNFNGNCTTYDVYRGSGLANNFNGSTTSSIKIKKEEETECTDGYGLSGEQIDDYMFLVASIGTLKRGGRYFSISERVRPSEDMRASGGYEHNNKIVIYRLKDNDTEELITNQLITDIEDVHNQVGRSWFSNIFHIKSRKVSEVINKSPVKAMSDKLMNHHRFVVHYDIPVEYDAIKVKKGIMKKYSLSDSEVNPGVSKTYEIVEKILQRPSITERMKEYKRRKP